MLGKLVLASIHYRGAVIGFLAALLLAGFFAAKSLPVDALPDVSTVQVTVLTSASGLTPVEMERTVTMPIENALNGTPGAEELRSVSRSGLSVVTLIFKDGTDVWFARQLVLERLRGVELPTLATTPELAPVTTGLGEIFQFVVRSDHHSAMQLRTMLDWDVVPRIRNVPGVIEVNTMGGELKQFQVKVDRARLVAQGVSLPQVIDALKAANVAAGGGYVNRGPEAFTVRGQGLIRSEEELRQVVIRSDSDGTPVLVQHVADVEVGPALRYGVITHNGKGEAVYGIVMMLLGANSRDVVHAVATRVDEIQKLLPAGVQIEVIYDRADFVGRTISTVMHNLLEGVLIVTVVLALFLGTVRGALAVVIGIPAAMSVALLGMLAFDVTGNLMSLGAIDFGFLVDGPIVILEAIIAATAGRQLVGMSRARAYGDVASAVARPVAFAVAIIMLVYMPLLALEGVEGKMFRPMAITMACALFGALIYAVLFFPAVLVAMVPPSKGHGPRWLEWIAERYAAMAPAFLRLRTPLLIGAFAALGLFGWLFGNMGAEFVPRIFEGDAVVTVRRAPGISLDEARKLDLETEKVLLSFPEVETVLGMCGRAEVATDPTGSDNTDIMTRLKPLEEWTTTHDFDDLSVALKNKVEETVPGTYLSISQPIEDRTNQLISGSRADVQIQIFGLELEEMTRVANQIGKAVAGVRGTGDLRVERVLGAPMITAEVDRARFARYGVQVEDAFTVLRASREGVPVGSIYEQERRFDVRVLQEAAEPTAAALGNLFVNTGSGVTVPLREVLNITEGDGPTAVRRQDRKRAIRVDVNLRGRDLVSWVAEAQEVVGKAVDLPTGYQVEWGGQFKNFERAKKRLAVVIPVVVAIIFGMLLWMFQNVRFAVAVFILVPLSLTGGMIGLMLRGMPFSLPAAVGFIALGGIGVLNGVVIATEVRKRLHMGEELDQAIVVGTTHVVRAVLTTATVAALGFLPMAVATSAGAEVQQPLATVVVIGMFVGTA
ncbi:MAG TPA: CusA/CzcA family heavy metal efflux RND transporter, partial [Polyangiaceae bacterium]|nr:CusA/CzcA family heavy metal efflux RND transporter [Polyangiaceae bacterium]